LEFVAAGPNDEMGEARSARCALYKRKHYLFLRRSTDPCDYQLDESDSFETRVIRVSTVPDINGSLIEVFEGFEAMIRGGGAQPGKRYALPPVGPPPLTRKKMPKKVDELMFFSDL